MTNKRARNWCAVVYPDSAPENWQQEFDKLNLKWACSPLHDKDIDDDEQTKKAHYHIVITYAGNKSFDQVKDDLSVLNCPIPQVCRDVKSSVRYFIHLDHPHKYQYDKEDIQTFGGFDLGDIFALSKSEKNQVYKEIIAWIKEWDVMELYDLTNYAMEERPEWFEVVTSNTIFFNAYLKSNRHRIRKTMPDGVDQDGCKVSE